MKKWLSGLTALGLAFCVLVTLTAGILFAMHPRQWMDFVQVTLLMKQDFREPLSAGEMLDGAVAGLADSAGDQYTYYLTPERNRTAAMSVQGLTGGIGITIDGAKEAEDRLVIREVRADSGAFEAGLKVNDAILRVDDRLIADLTVDEAIALIRGEPETYIRLLIAREGEADTEYSVKRTNTITVETVQAGFLKEDYLPGRKIGYIHIDYFARNSAEMFNELLDGLLDEGAEALVLDLRYNGGGDVDATVRIAGRLLPDGEVMKLVLRETEQSFTVRDADPIDIPYVILVNGGSASASEILSGAVQDRKGGILVGSRTYGKGSVQSVYTLFSGSGLRVTEGRYYLPGGRSIDGEGILPDYAAEFDPASETDGQIAKAMELFKDIFDGKETVATLLEKSEAAGAMAAADGGVPEDTEAMGGAEEPAD